MKLFSMSRFQDVFVAQILGNLLAQQYVGMVNFLFEDRIPTSVWLNQDGVTHSQCLDLIGPEPLNAIFWRTQGKVGLYPKVPVPNAPAFNIAEFIETAMVNALPQPLISCPILEHSYVQQDRIKPDGQGSFVESGRKLLQVIPLIPTEGMELTQLRTKMDEQLFWPTLLYLCIEGQAICSYGPIIGQLFTTFEADLLTRLTRLVGARALIPFNNTVKETLQDIWSDRTVNKWPNPMYGTAPYANWIITLKNNVPIVGMPTLANRCFDQAINKFANPEAELLRYLCGIQE